MKEDEKEEVKQEKVKSNDQNAGTVEKNTEEVKENNSEQVAEEKNEKLNNEETKEEKDDLKENKKKEDEKKETKDDKKEKNKEKPKKSKKKAIIITIIVLVVIIAAGVGGYFLYKYLELKAPLESKWGETYYSYLKEGTIEGTKTKEDIGFIDGMENTKIEFAEVENEENPVMIVSYDKENETYNNIYQIEEGNVTYTKIAEPSDIELLYSIEEKSYHLYAHTENDTQDKYEPVSNIINSNSEEEKFPEYTIEKGEEISQETATGDKITISKYDETFIKPEVEESTKVDFNTNLSEEEMKNAMQNALDGYKPQDEIVTEEVKQEVTNKEEELTNKREEMQTAKEELERIEEEKIKITQANVQEKLREHFKWFSFLYEGPLYGMSEIYDIEDRTGEIIIPGTDSQNNMVEEVVGAKSIQDMRKNMEKYMTSSVISKIKSESMWYSPGEDFDDYLHDYNGKVYAVRGGIGGGPYIRFENAKVLSSEDGITKIQLEDIASLGETLEARITLTVEYDEETEKYMITDCNITNLQ